MELMIELGLSFKPDRTDEGVVVQRLDPTLDPFGHYSDIKCDVGPARHGVRQHVQREIDHEISRRQRACSGTQGSAVRPIAPEQPKKLVNVDFFGRPVESAIAEPSQTQSAKPATMRVFYRYHEGYSNAVRKGIKLRDLL